MEQKDSKNNRFLLTIVAIVAIVAIVIMVTSTSSRTYNTEDYAGQAARAPASVDFITEGKTKTALTAPITTNLTCTDSDGGINYYTFGIVTLTNGSYNYNYTDYCSGNTTLYERYCSGTQLKTTTHNCTYLCNTGKCINQTQTGNWTVWFDRDGPGGSGDWEQKINFPTVCMNPLAVQCVTVSGEIPSSQTGQFTHCELNNGFWCINSENNQTCLDYKVRWLCP